MEGSSDGSWPPIQKTPVEFLVPLCALAQHCLLPVQIPVSLVPFELNVNKPGRAVEDDPTHLSPVHTQGSQDGGLGSWFWSGPAIAIAAI